MEIIVRSIPLYPDTFVIPDDQRGYRYKPNASGIWVNPICIGQIYNQVTLNSQGLHDVEHTIVKSPNVRRLLILGDSVVASFEVPLENAFFRLLETRLNTNAQSMPIEVIASGHQAYGTDLEYLYYVQEGYRYQADLVLLLMQPHNDFRDNHPGLRFQTGFNAPYFTKSENETLFLHPSQTNTPTYPIHDFFVRFSKLYALLQTRIQARQPSAAITPTTERTMIAESWAVTFALIDQLRQEVEKNGAQFAVVVEQSFINPQEARLQIHEEIAERLDNLGIQYLSLLQAFDQAEETTAALRYSCDTHWTTAGHQLAAETIAPFVQNLLVDD